MLLMVSTWPAHAVPSPELVVSRATHLSQIGIALWALFGGSGMLQRHWKRVRSIDKTLRTVMEQRLKWHYRSSLRIGTLPPTSGYVRPGAKGSWD